MPLSAAGHVTVNGLSFAYCLDGPEGAPWLMFSNSLMTNLSLWDAQVAALTPTYRILRYDQRGHGGTDVPAQATSLDELASDALGLLDVFGVAQVTLAGVSMGAATALCLAARAPTRVARVIAADGQAATPPGGAAAWQQRIDFALAHGMPAFADLTATRWLTPRTIAADGPVLAHTREMIRATDRAGFIACARALQGYDFQAELPTIRQPALLIAGEKDGAMPKTMQAMRDRMPDARYIEIPDAGHLPNLEAPEKFNTALLSFLGETG